MSSGAGSRYQGAAWKAAHRRALLEGDFDDTCDHGVHLPLCEDPLCVADYRAIVEQHLEVIRAEAGASR